MLGKRELMTGPGQPDVFLSHAGEQKRCFVDYLREFLDREEVSHFLDEYSLQPGDKAWPTIVQALEGAAVGEHVNSWYTRADPSCILA